MIMSPEADLNEVEMAEEEDAMVEVGHHFCSIQSNLCVKASVV